MSKPLLFITGFLGAGKTTLLRALLEELQKRDLTADVILNDYENAEIDAATLPEHAASIVPIAASCVCCDSLNDLVKLCLAAKESAGDILLIELNGTADPLPLLETFTLLERKMPFSPRWQVGMVDVRHWGKRDEFAALEKRQLETATHWIASHTEPFSEVELDAVTSSVSDANPYATRSNASELAKELSSAALDSRGGAEVRNKIATTESSASAHDHEHRLSHRFTGCQFPMEGRFRKEEIIRLLESLPRQVVRAKTLVELEEPPDSRWLFERTGDEPVAVPLKVGTLTRAPSSLVCIGPGLDPEELSRLVDNHFQAEKLERR